jgi:hypothetical protein
MDLANSQNVAFKKPDCVLLGELTIAAGLADSPIAVC